jgi:hypothetical protein
MAKRRHRRSFIYWLLDTGKTTTAAAAAAHAGRPVEYVYTTCWLLVYSCLYNINIGIGYMHACMVGGDIDAWSTCDVHVSSVVR